MARAHKVLEKGRRFGSLSIAEYSDMITYPSGQFCHFYLCDCDCGESVRISFNHLSTGHTTSCGCAKKNCGHVTHGDSGSPEYKTWNSMKNRCNNERDAFYPYYGGRGIKVCDRWSDFSNFLSDMKRKPSIKHSIDRIDNEAGYGPENCKWSTKREQAINRRNVRLYPFEGRLLALSQISEINGVSDSAMRRRLKDGWPIDDALQPGKRVNQYG